MMKLDAIWMVLLVLVLAQGVALLAAWRARHTPSRCALAPGQLVYSPKLLLGAKIALGLTAGAFGFLLNLPVFDSGFVWLIVGASAAATGLSVACILIYEHERYAFEEDGVAYTSWSGESKRLRWIELRFLRHWDSADCLRLETQTGATATISTHLEGIAAFAATALRLAPPHAINAETREALEATAAGNPPRAPFDGV